MKKSNSIGKILALLFAVIAICCCILPGLEADAVSPVQLTVTSASGKAGEDVSVSINISPNSGLAAADMLLTYDSSKLIYKSYTTGSAASGGMSSVNTLYASDGNIKTIYNAFIHISGVTVAGSIMNIIFTINQGWEGSTPITLTIKGDKIYDSVFKEIEHTIANGRVSITTSTTNPSTSTVMSSTLAGETTASGSSTAVQTTVPVSVPVEDVVDALGPDGKNWDKNIDSLNDEQKEKIEDYFADAGTPVTIAPDGIYYIQTTAADTSAVTDSTTELTDNTAAKSSNLKAVIAVAVVGVILAAAFCIAYVKRNKSKSK